MNVPRIAICVVTFNSAPLIEDLVESLPAGADGTDWTLVFADNASSDSTIDEITRCAPDAALIRTGGNLGYAGGLNLAVEAAGEQDAYLILNADVRLTEGCVLQLFHALDEGRGITVPRLIDGEGALLSSIRREPSLPRLWADALIGGERAGRIGTLGEVVTDPAAYDSPVQVDWAEGSTQLISAKCWRVCGPWDTSYFLYSEETDYDLRARDAGLPTWYIPTAVAQHLRGDSAVSPRLWSLLVLNKSKLYSRRHGRVASALFWLGLVVRESSRAAIGKSTSRAALRDLLRPARRHQARGPQWLDGVRTGR